VATPGEQHPKRKKRRQKCRRFFVGHCHSGMVLARHCERSEAIQKAAKKVNEAWIASSLALLAIVHVH
jgi:hypothetical protein